MDDDLVYLLSEQQQETQEDQEELNKDFNALSPLQSSFNQILHGDVLFYDGISDPNLCSENGDVAQIVTYGDGFDELKGGGGGNCFATLANNLAFIESLVEQDMYPSEIHGGYP